MELEMTVGGAGSVPKAGRNYANENEPTARVIIARRVRFFLVRCQIGRVSLAFIFNYSTVRR